MNDFHYVDNALWCESLPVNEIAKEVRRPSFYLYSYKTLQNHFRTFDAAFSGNPHLCFSVRLIPTSPS